MQLKKKIRVLCLTLLLIISLASLVSAEEKIPFTIEGDLISYDSETGDFVAKGNVLANQQEMVLQADHLEGNMNTKDVHAYGKVSWQKGQDYLKGAEIFYNYGSQTGFLAQGEGRLFPYYLRADWLEKDAQNQITLKQGGDNCLQRPTDQML